MAVRAALPNAHITVSPVPAPRRSATTTTFLVGSLSMSNGCTIRKRTPSRSGVFLVDQTVPMTLPRNIQNRLGSLSFVLWEDLSEKNQVQSSKYQVQSSDLCKYFARVADVAR